MNILIDGDIFRYRCAAAAEKNYYLVELLNPSNFTEWKKFDAKREADAFVKSASTGVVGSTSTIWSRKEVAPKEHALQILKSSLEQAIGVIEEKYGKAKVRIFLSGKKNFRELVAKTKPYKGNREDTVKPAHFKDAGTYLVDVWSAETTEGFEADDAIGIAAMEAKDKGEAFCVVSNDKDLDQIPGLHYDWIKKELYEVSAKEAKTQFYTQLLSGDATDNIPGLPGVGTVTATKALAECQSPVDMMRVCMDMYQKAFDTDNWGYLAEQADLVYILRKPGEPWTKTKEGLEFCTKYSLPLAQA